MAKVAIGSIPEKIIYISRKPIDVSVGCEWDMGNDIIDGTKTVKQQVTPSFPIDSTDVKMQATAIHWASQKTYNYNTKAYEESIYTTQEIDNKPIKNVKVLSLEARGNGGRAYKALIDNFYIDLREDVLMDTLLQIGVDPGGILKGEYIWAKMKSQMKLVRIGSELHRLIVEFDSKKDIKPVSKKDLEVGGLYQDRKKNRVVFLGYVNTVNYNSTSRYNDTKSDFKFNTKKIRKAMLFHAIHDYESLDKQIKAIKNVDSSYYFRVQTTHKYIEKVDQILLPADMISRVRNKAMTAIKQQILEFTSNKQTKPSYGNNTAGALAWNIANMSPHLNMYPYNQTPVEPFDVKKFLIFA